MKERKVVKKRITEEDFDVFNGRAEQGMEVARALDSKRPIPHSTTVEVSGFAVEDFFAALTHKRFEILRLSKKAPRSITELAKAAHRDPSAVSRDVSKLVDLGLVQVIEVSNPGHGTKKVVTPVAQALFNQFCEACSHCRRLISCATRVEMARTGSFNFHQAGRSFDHTRMIDSL